MAEDVLLIGSVWNVDAGNKLIKIKILGVHMTGFPPITDSDGGMGFGPEVFFEAFLKGFFLFCCLPLILLYVVIAYFNARRKWKQHDALEAENQALEVSESPEGMENKITKYLGGRKKQI